MRSLSDQYRKDFSRTTQTFYWMNHCEHCGMKQGDFELFEEFDTPFCPVDVRGASRILLHPIQKRFEASATSIADEPGFFEQMRIYIVASAPEPLFHGLAPSDRSIRLASGMISLDARWAVAFSSRPPVSVANASVSRNRGRPHRRKPRSSWASRSADTAAANPVSRAATSPPNSPH